MCSVTWSYKPSQSSKARLRRSLLRLGRLQALIIRSHLLQSLFSEHNGIRASIRIPFFFALANI